MTRHRLVIEITEAQWEELSKIFDPMWGVKSPVFRVLIDGLIKAADEHGAETIVSLILARKISVGDITGITGEK